MTLINESAPACCFFIPPFMLSNIVESPHASDAARENARNALAKSINMIECHQNSIIQQLNAPTQEAAQVQTNSPHSVSAKAVPPKRRNRIIYSAKNTLLLDKTLLRNEKDEDASGDPSADECFDNLGATYKFYDDIFDRNSINNKGMSLIGTVHYDINYGNAHWDGKQMVFGDGDNTFHNFTSSLDVIGHELTHGVTQYTANLVYQREPGALNESISDVFGSMVKQYHLDQTSAEADWLIGVGLFTSTVDGTVGKAVRSMSAPGTAYDHTVLGKDPQVAYYNAAAIAAHPIDFKNDYGGVHIYSGIPNRAFYLVATKLGGKSWERAGKIWWEALTDRRLGPTSDFPTFAKLTSEKAESLYDQSVKAVVDDAWKDVGVHSGAKEKPVPKPEHLHAQNV